MSGPEAATAPGASEEDTAGAPAHPKDKRQKGNVMMPRYHSVVGPL